MNLLHDQSDTKGTFYIKQNGLKVAEMTFTKNGKYRIIVDHTEVSESQKGKGLEKKLIYHVANYANEEKMKILPLCPFASRVFNKTKIYIILLSQKRLSFY